MLFMYSCKDIGLAVNTGKTKYMEMGRQRGMFINELIRIGIHYYEKVKSFSDKS